MSGNDDIEQSYQDLLDEAVRRYTDTPVTWEILSSNLSGACPIAVCESVARLNRLGQVSTAIAPRSCPVPVPLQLWRRGSIPTPHILDSTWWFADQALENLVEMIGTFSYSGDTVLLLGTPTLYFVARDKFSDRNLILADQTASASSDGTLRVDVTSHSWSIPRSASLVVADPPWYREDLSGFLAAASRSVRIGGTVLLSFPGSLTRPGVELDREELVRQAAQLGLRLEQHLASRLRYLTPPFEWNAHQAAGLGDLPPDWRCGDLLLFEKADTGRPAILEMSSRAAQWLDFQVGVVRFKLLAREESDSVVPALRAIVPGDVLSTVSRRDNRIGEVRLWTSGNRVYACDGANEIALVLSALAERNDPLALVRLKGGFRLDPWYGSAIEAVSGQLRGIIECEERELAEWNQRVGGELDRCFAGAPGRPRGRESSKASGDTLRGRATEMSRSPGGVR